MQPLVLTLDKLRNLVYLVPLNWLLSVVKKLVLSWNDQKVKESESGSKIVTKNLNRNQHMCLLFPLPSWLPSLDAADHHSHTFTPQRLAFPSNIFFFIFPIQNSLSCLYPILSIFFLYSLSFPILAISLTFSLYLSFFLSLSFFLFLSLYSLFPSLFLSISLLLEKWIFCERKFPSFIDPKTGSTWSDVAFFTFLPSPFQWVYDLRTATQHTFTVFFNVPVEE